MGPTCSGWRPKLELHPSEPYGNCKGASRADSITVSYSNKKKVFTYQAVERGSEVMVVFKFFRDGRVVIRQNTFHNLTVVEVLCLRHTTFEGVGEYDIIEDAENSEVDEVA